jgi:predicted RNA-binding protein (TIGR00451 family)
MLFQAYMSFVKSARQLNRNPNLLSLNISSAIISMPYKSRRHAKNEAELEALKSKLSMSLDYVFGRAASKPINFDELEFELSPRTGRLRYVRDKSTSSILFTFRSNGSIAPTIKGANLMLGGKVRKEFKRRPLWTITVIDGVSAVVSSGKTVFCRHVVHCDNSLRANEDVLILNEKGELLAVGRSVLSGVAIKQFKRGVAVKVREGSSLSENVTTDEHGQ